MNKTTLNTTAAIAMLLTGLSMNLAADSDSKETAAAQQAAKITMDEAITIAEQTTGGKSSTLHTGHRKFWLPALQFRDHHRHNLKRSSAIQQGLLNISIFLLSLFLLSLLTYFLVQSTLQERVFQRLYRLDKSRSDQRGTGLGLSLIKAIIELHDARIELADNEPGLKVVMQFPALTQS